MECLICGKESSKSICHKCKARLPFDYPKYLCNTPISLLTEYKRNERLKNKFRCDTKLGKVECDMLNGIIKIKNAYHSIKEFKTCTFFVGEPRFSGFWRREIYENVYFVYQLRNGIRQSIKVQTAICHYRTDGRYVHIEPPLCVSTYKQVLSGMIDDMQRKLAAFGVTEEILSEDDNTTVPNEWKDTSSDGDSEEI